MKCLQCLSAFCQALPVVIILLITIWSYYAYVVAFCIDMVRTIHEKVLFLIVYHILFLMFSWGFLKAVFSRPQRPPHEYFLSASDWEHLNSVTDEMDKNQILEKIIADRKLTVDTTGITGFIRTCPTCSVIKPDRCHHCSTCGCCLLKMDHHCPWINNCVGFHNYKQFVLFLFWGSLYCIFIIGSTVSYFINFWKDTRGATVSTYIFLFLFFLAVMFGLSQLILFFYHVYLLSINRTTVEGFRAPTFRNYGVDKYGFNVGCRQNFKEVFGENCCLWLMPVSTSRGNGCVWPRNGFKGCSYQSVETAK